MSVLLCIDKSSASTWYWSQYC